jgi:hypothetical protein
MLEKLCQLILILELLKIKTYRAPRDKIICVLNCCKVIFGKHSGCSQLSFPLLRLHRASQTFQIRLIRRFICATTDLCRSPSESRASCIKRSIYLEIPKSRKVRWGGWVLPLVAGEPSDISTASSQANISKLGAVQFIENLDRTTLTISDEEFEQSVEAAVSAIAEKHQTEAAKAPPPTQLGETSALPKRSLEAEPATIRKSNTPKEYESGDGIDEKAAMSGLLRTIQQPFSTIGRIFSEESSSLQGPPRTPLSGNSPRTTVSPLISTDRPRSSHRPANLSESSAHTRMTAEDSAARQSSAEAAEAQRIQRAEHSNVVETLAGMFPDLDREIISDVVTQKEGRVGLAVDACLALSS